MWPYILILFLIALCVWLFVQHMQLRRDVQKITTIAKAIRLGEMNRRFLIRTTRKDFVNCSEELNRLTDNFQDSYARTKALEEERQRMISNISHDLRTPLTSMLGYIDALRDDESIEGDEKTEYLRIVSEKGADVNKLIQDFFELARLEESNEELLVSKLDISELVRTVLLDFYPEFTKIDITPQTDIPDGPVYLSGNEDAIKRILQNLISNALRYGADGKNIGVNIRQEPENIWVDVFDNGKGIPEKDLAQIFERFYTTEKSRNASLRGTGIGLTIVKTLVEKQGGMLVCASIPDEKTVFSFCLPAAQV